VHLPIPDIQSLSVPASPLPDHIADLWLVQAGLGFSLFCCGTMPTLVYVLLYGKVKAESFVKVQSLFLDFCSHMWHGVLLAWPMAILFHLQAQ